MLKLGGRNAVSLCVFWTGEGIGVEWAGYDLILIVFVAIFLITSLTTARAIWLSSQKVRL